MREQAKRPPAERASMLQGVAGLAPSAESPGSRWVVLALLVLATLLRIPWLGGELWLDEAYTANLAAKPVPEMFAAFASDNKPPLYPLVMKGWLAVVGNSELALRSFSVFFGVLTVWLLHRFGTQLAGARAGLAAAAFAAMSPLAIYYSCEARNYSFVAAMVLLAVMTLHRAMSSHGRPRDWALHGAVVSVCLYTSYVAGPVALVGLVMVVAAGTMRDRLAWLLAMAGVAVVFAPWIPAALAQLANTGATLKWLVPFWESYPPLLAIPRSFLAFMPGGQVPPVTSLPTVGALQPALAVGAIAIVVLALLPRAALVVPARNQVTLLVLAYLLVPLLIPFVYSFWNPIYIVGRSDYVAFPAFCLLVGIVWSRLRLQRVRLVAAALMIGACIVSWTAFFAGPGRVHERAMLERLAQTVAAGDLVICTDYSRPTAEYYLRRDVPGLSFASYPLAMADNPAVIDRSAYGDQPERLKDDSEELAAKVRGLGPGRSAWLLWVGAPMNRPLQQAFEHHGFHMTQVGQYRLNQSGIRVRVFRVASH